jgi:purine-binding chemotaxis protein CheW
MEEAKHTASPEKKPADDANCARTTFQPAPPDSNPAPAGLQEHLSAVADRQGKYLTFTLAGEEYGIGILKIKEIIGMMSITSVPQTPKFVKGVINLRGKVIPVVDLRLRFAMDAIDYNERTCIIVVEIGGRGTGIVIGIVVDSVSEVLNIKNEEIEDTPTFGTTLNTDYILGMAKMEGKVKILLDIDTVLSQDDIDMLQKAA